MSALAILCKSKIDIYVLRWKVLLQNVHMYGRRPTIPRTTKFAVMLVIVLTLVPVYAQKPSTPTTTTPSQDGTDRLTEYEREMLRIENAKLEQQERASFYTLATIVLTALIGFATVVSTIGVANSQARNQANLANEQAQLLAKLKALEIVTNATGPTSAGQRFEIVKKLLGEELLGEELLSKDPSKAKKNFFDGVGPGHDQSRKELIKMLLEYPERQEEVLRFWETAFKENDSVMKIIEALRTRGTERKEDQF